MAHLSDDKSQQQKCEITENRVYIKDKQNP